MNLVIYAADIGSVRAGHFGWARIDCDGESVDVGRDSRTEIAEMVEAVSHDLNAGRAVALGFECPLFIPVPVDAAELGRARRGEGNRPWSGGPGTGALATGLVETAWILDEIRQRCGESIAHLDWYRFAASGVGLFLWEAFVTGSAKAASHIDDALIAANTFRDALPLPTTSVTAERPLSLLGTALLWSGWTSDLEVLHTPCVALRSSPSPAVPMNHEPHADRVPQVKTRTRREHREPLRDLLSAKAQQIPAGSWTSYGAIAAMIGSHARPVATCLGTWPIPNAHRILTVDGELSAGFAFRDGRTDDPVEALEAEGIRFTNGRADPQQRWNPEIGSVV